MNHLIKIFFLLVIASQFVLSQDESIQNLFPGKWKMEIENAEVFEEWSVIDDSELIAKSFTIENADTSISEMIYLKKFSDDWAYVAIPENQSITLFSLVNFTNKKFTFENKEHDFPQRIIYEFHKDGKMTASIEGDVNGKFIRKEFSYRIVEN